jgi:acetyltransferase-like isoleucine patch superfamily enzyme
MKGVTVGERAIVGVSSVVVKDVPVYSIAMENPAQVV